MTIMILLFLLFILVISVLCETVIEEQENMNIVNETLYSNKRLTEKDDLRRKRKQRDREKENLITAKKTVEAGSTEYCDWKTQPLAVIRGEVCGSYYKVLGLDRKRGIIDKTDIKKAYRQKSLNVHPDKNSSPEANEAFKVVQEAYECLIDAGCKSNYDRQLGEVEQNISSFREELKRQLVDKALGFASNLHYYVSVTAHHIYQAGLDIWDVVGEMQVEIFGKFQPIGQALFLLGLMWKGRFLLQIHAIAYFIVRVNYELAKARGLL